MSITTGKVKYENGVMKIFTRKVFQLIQNFDRFSLTCGMRNACVIMTMYMIHVMQKPRMRKCCRAIRHNVETILGEFMKGCMTSSSHVLYLNNEGFSQVRHIVSRPHVSGTILFHTPFQTFGRIRWSGTGYGRSRWN